MSLIAWYPLLGNGNNQGLDDTNLDIMGTVPYNAGKIGNAATFSGVAANCLHRPSFNLTDNFTWACWVKITNTVSTYQFILSEGRDYEKYGMNLITFTNGNIGLMYGTNSTLVILSSPVLNTWYHITIVVSSTEGIKGYVNGNLAVTGPYRMPDYTYNSSRFTIGKMSYSYTNTAYYFPLNGQINDVRIYNHALSVKEIKEISKGLVLHYPLDNNNMGNKNMAIGSDENTSWAWTMQTGGYTRTFEEADGGTWCCLTRDSVAQSGWSVIYYNNEISRSEIEPNSTYTISLEILPSHNFRLGLSIMNVNGTDVLTNGTAYQDLQANVINKVVMTVTTSSTLPSSTGQRLYMTGMNNSVGASYKFRRVKMEKGDKATTWCPNKTDALYSAWGLDSVTIYDCSGYKYHGAVKTLLPCSVDTVRHTCSTIFDGVSSSLILPVRNLMNELLSNQCTISFWCNEADISSRSIYFGGWGDSPFNIEMLNGKLRVYWNGAPDIQECNVINNTWILWTITIDKATGIKIYKNGVYEYSYNSALSTLTLKEDFYIGRDTRDTGDTLFEGKMSDFRIYATALSAEEIKELYQIPISVDKAGNIFGYEFIEETKPEFNKTGIVEHQKLMESSGANILGTEFIGQTYSYIPSAGSNATMNTVYADVSNLQPGEKVWVKVDVEWSGFDTSNTSGTFALFFQGDHYSIANDKWEWTGGNAICSALNSVASSNRLTGLVLSQPSGKTTLITSFTSTAYPNTYNKVRIGVRSDYSNGVGSFTMSNIEVIPDKYYIDKTFKIGKTYLSTNQIIEV